jgi:hypothetical protein
LSERPLQVQIVPLAATLVSPHNGSTIHGKQFVLDVFASGSYNVTKVMYFLSRPGSPGNAIATGAITSYGWIALWDTSKVSNGVYTIDARVDDTHGRSVTTSSVNVRVKN